MAARDLLRLVVGLAVCVLLQGAQAASAVHKCVIAGTVTFQNTPCPAETPTRRPTTEALNAERKKRLAESPPASAPATPTART